MYFFTSWLPFFMYLNFWYILSRWWFQTCFFHPYLGRCSNFSSHIHGLEGMLRAGTLRDKNLKNPGWSAQRNGRVRSFRGGEGAKAISNGLRADISMSKFVYLYRYIICREIKRGRCFWFCLTKIFVEDMFLNHEIWGRGFPVWWVYQYISICFSRTEPGLEGPYPMMP